MPNASPSTTGMDHIDCQTVHSSAQEQLHLALQPLSGALEPLRGQLCNLAAPFQRTRAHVADQLQQHLHQGQSWLGHGAQQQRSTRAIPSSWLQPAWVPVLASIHLGSAFGALKQRSHGQQQQQQGQGQGAGLSSCMDLTPKAIGGAQPLYELAMAKDEVKARLAPIPVFTVANPKNEFVLVAGENNTQLGFFFFKREDADAIVEKIREENPRLARDSKILKVTMDNVYEVFTTPREQTGLQGIHFRFMPDMRQVAHALALYKDAGVPTRSFTGVPVFQAEGLTVTTQEMQYVPLFLSKEDLDIAVQNAYRQRNAAQIQVYRDKANKFEDEYNQVAVQAESATGREKVSLQSRATKLRTKLDAAKEKAEAVERAPMPKIEVGSFEEVMQRMTESSGQDLAAWSQVMFVAPGLLQQQTLTKK